MLTLTLRPVLPALALIVIGVAAPASAQEYCVVCAAPDATYRCTIVDPRPSAAPSLQAACLGALAKAGRHTQCSIRSGVTVFECDAPVTRVSLAGAEPVVVAPPAPSAPDPSAPPKTLLEAAQRAKSSADAQAAKAAEQTTSALNATGAFFKKSLTCLGTLFTRCQ